MRRILSFLALLCFPLFALAGSVNINTATQAELETLPGIGETKALAIIQYRTDNGPFKSVDELDNVSGIGPATLASVRDLVTVDSATGGDAKTTTVGTSTGAATSTGTSAAASTGTSAASSTAATSTAASSSAGCPVNINTADASGLKNLPGIGDSKAAAILQYRTDNGPFGSCNDLDSVSGIGSATLAGLIDCCVVK